MLRFRLLAVLFILGSAYLLCQEQAIPFEDRALAALKTEGGMAFWGFRGGGIAYWLEDEEKGFYPLGQAWLGEIRILKKASGRGFLAYAEGRAHDGSSSIFLIDADALGTIVSVERRTFDYPPILHRFELISSTRAKLLMSSGNCLLQCSMAIEESGRVVQLEELVLSDRYVEGSGIAIAVHHGPHGLATAVLFKEIVGGAEAFSVVIAGDLTQLEQRRAILDAEGAEAARVVADASDQFPLAIISCGGSFRAMRASREFPLPDSLSWLMPGERAALGQDGKVYAAGIESGVAHIREKDGGSVSLEGARIIVGASGFVIAHDGEKGLSIYSVLARDALIPLNTIIPVSSELFVVGSLVLATHGSRFFLCDLPMGVITGPYPLSAPPSRRLASPQGSLCLLLGPSAASIHGAALYCDEAGL